MGVSKHTLYSWKAKDEGMDVSEAQEVKQLRDENTRLKKTGGGSQPRQECFAVGDSKKRVGLVEEMKASVEHLRTTFAFSQTTGMQTDESGGFDISIPAGRR